MSTSFCYNIIVLIFCFSNQGAQWLGVNAPLCKVTSDGGKIFTLVSCVKGQLIEVNEALIENPNLILEKVIAFFEFYFILREKDMHASVAL